LSYITRDFLIEFVNAIVHKEGQGKKPVYNLHRWWARRMGTTFRMILLTALSRELDPVEQTSATATSARSTTKPPASTAQVAFCLAKRTEIWYTILSSQIEKGDYRVLAPVIPVPNS